MGVLLTNAKSDCEGFTGYIVRAYELSLNINTNLLYANQHQHPQNVLVEECPPAGECKKAYKVRENFDPSPQPQFLHALKTSEQFAESIGTAIVKGTFQPYRR